MVMTMAKLRRKQVSYSRYGARSMHRETEYRLKNHARMAKFADLADQYE